MDLKKIKTLGNKIYTTANKITEADRSGMETRIPAYIETMEKTHAELKIEIKKVKDEFN